MGFKILIIKLGALGDVIRTTSILKGLKEKYPNCKIDWVTYKYCFELLQIHTSWEVECSYIFFGVVIHHKLL